MDDSVIDRVGNRLRCTYSWQAWSLEKGSEGTKSVRNSTHYQWESLATPFIILCQARLPKYGQAQFISLHVDQIKRRVCQAGYRHYHYSPDDGFEGLLPSHSNNNYSNWDLVKLWWWAKVIMYSSMRKFELQPLNGKKRLNMIPHFGGLRFQPNVKLYPVLLLAYLTSYSFAKCSTRSYYLMDFSTTSLRSVQMWRCWLAHNLIEQMKENLEVCFSHQLNAT